MKINLLTDKQIKNTKPQDKQVSLIDGAGLYLRISSNGRKEWISFKALANFIFIK